MTIKELLLKVQHELITTDGLIATDVLEVEKVLKNDLTFRLDHSQLIKEVEVALIEL